MFFVFPFEKGELLQLFLFQRKKLKKEAKTLQVYRLAVCEISAFVSRQVFLRERKNTSEHDEEQSYQNSYVGRTLISVAKTKASVTPRPILDLLLDKALFEMVPKQQLGSASFREGFMKRQAGSRYHRSFVCAELYK